MKKKFSAQDKVKAAFAAIQGVDSLAAIASRHTAHPVQVGLWKKKLLTGAHTIFDTTNREATKNKALVAEIDELHRIIGQRDAELVWLQKKSGP